ncbi:hypothetical protein [Pseudooceanicola sp. LIPI14-2-Ac024]|uniref:hypothetical protein n=1 Tax=Pseudooceanicola sp. LIPI14-2-Ac024 TaxID=3344875 RepID=UPI0035CED0FE
MAVDKRAARAAWKDRTEAWVIYAARTGGQVWVGISNDVAAAENRLGFTLRQGQCRVPGMQAAFDDTLDVEVLEELDPELGPMARQEVARVRRDAWAAELGAGSMDR